MSGTQGAVKATIGTAPLQPTVKESAPAQGQIGDFLCSTATVEMSDCFSDALLLDPLTDVVWPGSVVDGSRWANGEYRLIAEERMPLSITLSIPALTNAPVSTKVDRPSLATVAPALNELKRGLVGQMLPAGINASVEEMHSVEQLQVALRAGYSGVLGTLKGKFDYSSSSATNKYIWRFQQVYYTADVTPPTRTDQWFSSGRAPQPNEMYVTSVSYGRMLLFTLESSEEKSAIEAALEYAKGKSVSASLAAKYEKTLSRSKINVLILGGQTGPAEAVVTDGVAGIKNYIRAGGVFGPNTLGIPLSYRLRFLSDNALGYIGLTTTYTRRHCVRTTATYQVDGLQLKVGTVSDPNNDLELFGTVWVSGGVAGTTASVPVVPTGEVWKRDKKHYVTLRRDQVTPATIAPRLTFQGIQQNFDRCFIQLLARLYDYDDIGANDLITGGAIVLWLRDVVPGQRYSFPVEGDGNRVYIEFSVRDVQT